MPKKDPYAFFLRTLRRLMDRYEGQYVVIVGTTVVAHGKPVKRVYEVARHKLAGERLLIGQAPTKQIMILQSVCSR